VAIPVVVEQLVTAIEFYGLRQEGLYRKSGINKYKSSEFSIIFFKNLIHFELLCILQA